MDSEVPIDSEALENTAIELFWGQELSAKNKSYEYTGESDEEEGIETTIELRGACLGVNAKNERNIVNVTTEDTDGNTVTHTILSMRLEKNEQVPLFLNIKPPMKLELVQGSGPLSIVGNMSSVLTGDMSDDESEGEEESTDAAVDLPVPTRKMKRPAESPIERPAKKNVKSAKIEQEVDNSDEEDSEMDTTFDLPPKKLKSKAKNDEADNEEEDDEDEDDDDVSDEEDDDNEEEEEESSEEEEIVKPVVTKKSSKVQAVKKQMVKGSQTPKPKKPIKSIIKQPSSVPKESKKTFKVSTPSVDEIKKRLISSPGLPKKLDKFNNLLKNNYKISDDNTKKELWEFVQKSKKV